MSEKVVAPYGKLPKQENKQTNYQDYTQVACYFTHENRKSFRMAPPLFHLIENNLVSNLLQFFNEISLFVKISEEVVAPYGKLS